MTTKPTRTVIAVLFYWPLARLAKLAERMGRDVVHLPLSIYRNRTFYVMRTDALDRFGTRIEHRFTRLQIEQLVREAGLDEICFSEDPPYWIAVVRRADSVASRTTAANLDETTSAE